MFMKRNELRSLVNIYKHYFQTSSLERLGQSKSNQIWSLHGKDDMFYNIGKGHMTKMADMSMYGKIFQTSSFQEPYAYKVYINDYQDLA